MVLEGLSHLAIATPDVDRSIAFYRDLLGFELLFRDTLPPLAGDGQSGEPAGDRYYALLRAGDVLLTINQHAPVVGDEAVGLTATGLNHVAFWVADLEAATAPLEAAGVEFAIRRRRLPGRSYGVEGKVLTSIFKDPDGTHIQLDQREA